MLETTPSLFCWPQRPDCTRFLLATQDMEAFQTQPCEYPHHAGQAPYSRLLKLLHLIFQPLLLLLELKLSHPVSVGTPKSTAIQKAARNDPDPMKIHHFAISLA